MPESIVEATSAADYQVFGALIRDDYDKWAKLIKEANIKGE